jgi:hypothetical protein
MPRLRTQTYILQTLPNTTSRHRGAAQVQLQVYTRKITSFSVRGEYRMKKDELMKAFELMKLQGFETPAEMFIVGYIMAHGGEQYILEITAHDLDLLEKAEDRDFWLPHIKDDLRIHRKVNKDDIVEATTALKGLLEARQAKIPEWVKQYTHS